MTGQAEGRIDLETRARERYKRAKRIEWSILCRNSEKDDLVKLVELLKDALNETRLELSNLEQQLGYKIKDQEDKETWHG